MYYYIINVINKDNTDMIQNGTIFSGALSYSGRIPYFFRVVKSTEKTVWLEKLKKYTVDDDGYGQNGTCMPDLVATATREKRSFRIKYNKEGNPFIKYDNYIYLHIWDHTPETFYTD